MAQPHPDAPEGGFGLERLIFFSDAVIAIAITLLVLDIHVPEVAPTAIATDLPRQVLALWPNYLGYFTSFWVIGYYWMAHHRLFRHIQAYDQGLVSLNLTLLFFIAFMPFPTALLFRYPAQPISVMIYAGTLVLIGLSMVGVWQYALHRQGLVEAGLEPKRIRQITISLLIAPAIFLLSMGVAVWNGQWAMYTWLLLLPIYFFFRPQRPAPKGKPRTRGGHR